MLNRGKKFERLAEKEERSRKEQEQISIMEILKQQVLELKDQLEKGDYDREEEDRNMDILRKLYKSQVMDRHGNLLQ